MDNTNKKYMKKLMNKISSILFYALIIVLFVFSIANIKMNKSNDIAHILGNGFLSVQTDSMNGEDGDSFKSGDVIFVKMIDETMQANLSIGEIVTYYDTNTHRFNTSRIVKMYKAGSTTYIETQGDSAITKDLPIKSSEVLAVYQNRISGFGSSLDYLQSPQGYALFIILPVIIILVFEGILLAQNLIHHYKATFYHRFASDYKKVLKNLDMETIRIRQQIVGNWIHKNEK